MAGRICTVEIYFMSDILEQSKVAFLISEEKRNEIRAARARTEAAARKLRDRDTPIMFLAKPSGPGFY